MTATATLLARRRIDFADGLHWLPDRGKSGAAACRTFMLNPIRDWFFHFESFWPRINPR
jgi:hypothetical protein